MNSFARKICSRKWLIILAFETLCYRYVEYIMAKETTRFEARCPYKADDFEYHSLIKSEFIDNLELSEEENYSFYGNIDKEGKPPGLICVDKYIPYIKKCGPDTTEKTSNFYYKSNYFINNYLKESNFEEQTENSVITKDNLADKENVELTNKKDDLNFIPKSKQALPDILDKERKIFNLEVPSIITKCALKFPIHSTVLRKEKAQGKRGKHFCEYNNFIYDIMEKTKPNILRNSSKKIILASNIPIISSEIPSPNTCIFRKHDHNESTTKSTSSIERHHQSRTERESSVKHWISTGPLNNREIFMEESHERSFLCKNKDFLEDCESRNTISNIQALHMNNTKDRFEEHEGLITDLPLQALEINKQNNCIENPEYSGILEFSSVHSFEIENKLKEHEEEYTKHVFSSGPTTNMIDVGAQVELPSVTEKFDDSPNKTSSFKDSEVMTKSRNDAANKKLELNFDPIQNYKFRPILGNTNKFVNEVVIKKYDDPIVNYTCNLSKNIGKIHDHVNLKLNQVNKDYNSCGMKPKIECLIKLSKLKHLTKIASKTGHFWRKVFKCDLCEKVFKKFKTWHDHLSVHYTPCNFCKAIFSDFNKYLTHVHETHAALPFVNVTKLEVIDFDFFVSNTKSSKKICILCKKVLLTRERCINHIMECHSYEVFTWKDKGVIKKQVNNSFFLRKFAFALDCPLCKLSFERESDFHSHMQYFHHSHAFCADCNLYVFNSKLPIHKKKHAKEECQWREAEIEYSCASCELNFSSSELFARHLNKVQCAYCANGTFCSTKALEDHQVDEHTDMLYGLCSFCYTGFYKLDDLLRHMMLAHSSSSENENLWTCQLCISASLPLFRYYTSRNALEQHMLFHCIVSTMNNYSPSSKDLRPHIDMISNSVPKSLFECKLCSDIGNASFESFILHLKDKHPNAFIGFCAFCENSYTSNEALLHPVVEHFASSGSRLICLICNSSHETPASALQHTLMSHYTLFGKIPLHIQLLMKDVTRNPLDTCFELNKCKFLCDYCAIFTSGYLGHIVHLYTLHNVHRTQITCKVCQTCHPNLWSYIVHVCVHQPDTHHRKKINHKAIIRGLQEPIQTHENIKNNMSQGNYSGISGEHNYACLNLGSTHANALLVHQDHDYCGLKKT